MRADAAASEGARASHQGLADGYAALIAGARACPDPPAAGDEQEPAPIAALPMAEGG